MFLKKAVSVGVLLKYKIRFGKRLVIRNIRQSLCIDTEIVIGKGACLSLGKVSGSSGLHLLCALGEMDIGNACFNRHCIISGRYRIKIGDNCFFGPNVCVYDHDHKYTLEGVQPHEFKCSEIVIEDGCWIGAGVIILRGTHIGKNSVIEAGAVVKGDIPPNSLIVTERKTRIIPAALFMGSNNMLSAETS